VVLIWVRPELEVLVVLLALQLLVTAQAVAAVVEMLLAVTARRDTAVLLTGALTDGNF